MTALETLNISDILQTYKPLPEKLCGIYFLTRDGRIVYVGRSVDIEDRVAAHVKHDEKKFDGFCWVPCKAKFQSELERRYLDQLLPELNRDALTNAARKAAAPFVESMKDATPRVRKGRLTPHGCYWRGDKIWARTKINGQEFRASMLTSSPKEASLRRDIWLKSIATVAAQSGTLGAQGKRAPQVSAP